MTLDTLPPDFIEIGTEPATGTEDLPLSLARWISDYLLITIFILVGPLYYIAETFPMTHLTLGGRMGLLALELGIHFAAATAFSMNHFVEPRTRDVMVLLTMWRWGLVLWSALCWYGFWPNHIWMPGPWNPR